MNQHAIHYTNSMIRKSYIHNIRIPTFHTFLLRCPKFYSIRKKTIYPILKIPLTSHHYHHPQPPSKMAPSSIPQDDSLLVRFYDPYTLAPDSKGRTLTNILAWSDTKLEASHDYIQVLFPLPEGSMFNWIAPIVDESTFRAFRSRSELRNGVKKSFTRILRFYGFELQMLDGGGIAVQPATHSDKAFRNWVVGSDHNHLRITRILRSLRVLGLEREAEAFFVALRRVFEESGKIGSTSMMFWTRAAKRPLYLAPDQDEDAGNGTGFLYEYEKSRDRTTVTTPR